ncbi:uncharacterized protein FLJ37770 [Trichonephila clavipes]|uniref:Uncharacterized protein FLJ37770 n=1 Tax=Trichonephila clavipes TaxID=2585209 RepID=A0A8X6RLP2_TRICX|nr:uncharacterized protein FLJ37770 [Trichonephila clavipes]
MEQRNMEQRCVIKFCVKLEEPASVKFQKLKQSCGEHSLSRAQVYHWRKSFLEGKKHVEYEHRSGGPSTSKKAVVAKWSRYRIVAGKSRVRAQYHEGPAMYVSDAREIYGELKLSLVDEVM